MDHVPEPVACSLTTADAARQALEWTDLRRHAITIEARAGGAAMTFALDLADDVEDLAAREAACCAFLSITTNRMADVVRLEITSDDPDAHTVIEALAGTR
jgi:hypothetical protein